MHGTWNQPNGQISVPAALGGGTVASNNTLVFDDSQAQSTFTLTMNLSFSGLTDTLTAKGTALGDVLLAFVRWGKQYIPGTVTLNQERATGGSAASTTSSRGVRVKRPG